jgi:hypothetical protein
MVLLVTLGFLGGSMPVSGASRADIKTSSAGKGRGPHEVAVVVDLDQPAAACREFSRSQLQAALEAQLRQAGVTVVPPKPEGALPRSLLIYVNVKIAAVNKRYAYNADIMCMAGSQKNRVPAKLAKGGHLGTAGVVPEIGQVRDKVEDLLNCFIRDYLSSRGGLPAMSLGRPRPGRLSAG